MNKLFLTTASIAIAGFCLSGNVYAQNTYPATHATQAQPMATQPAAQTQNATQAPNADDLVNDAVKTVQEMKRDAKFANYMKQAKGIFIVPTLVRGALIVGGQGGQGVLLAHRNGTWSDPAFFSMGSVSIGAQAGGEAGPVAFLLMTNKALNSFTESNNFSLNANAGLTIVTYSARGQADVGKGDIILWSNTSGLEAGVNVSATDIVKNNREDKNSYGRAVSTQQIIAGKVANPAAARLRDELPA
ncbi:MAG: lipid-binding SYLF domain-containing protein [Stellaceae bacterium]